MRINHIQAVRFSYPSKTEPCFLERKKNEDNNKKKKIGIVVCMDMLMIFLMGWYGSSQKFPTLTTFQCVLIGIGCVIVFLGLYFIKVIGSMIRLFCSLFWALAVARMMPLEEWTNNSKPWMIGVKAGLFLLFLGIHMRFYEDWKDDFSNESSEHQFIKSKRKEKKLRKELWTHFRETAERFEEAVLGFEGAKKATSAVGKSMDDIEYLITYTQETLPELEKALKRDNLEFEDLEEIREYLENVDGFTERLFQNMEYLFEEYYRQAHSEGDAQWEEAKAAGNKESEAEKDVFEEMLFAGCNDAESVSLRYKQLMRSFHPDQQNGDEEMAKRIQNAYEARIKKYGK